MARSRHSEMLGIAVAALVLTGCLGGSGGGSSGGDGASSDAPSESSGNTLSGQVINGPLAGAEIDVFGPDAQHLTTITADAQGLFSADLDEPGPYTVETSGGAVDGTSYAGHLEARCHAAISCSVTPISTAIVQLMEQQGMEFEDARALLGNRIGIAFDPFASPEDAEGRFDLLALRGHLDAGRNLDSWLIDLLIWITEDIGALPVGILLPTSEPGADAGFEPDVACTGFEIDIDEDDIHYKVETHEQMVGALTDPSELAGDRLVIAITGDITTGFNEGSDEWQFEGDKELVLIGQKEDGSRAVIDAGQNSRILYAQPMADRVILSGLELRNGNARNGPSFRLQGGAVHVRHTGRLVLHDTAFINNEAGSRVLLTSGRGGAVVATGPVLIAHSEFRNNFSRQWGGAVVTNSGISVCHTIFEGNQQAGTSASHGGSAIHARQEPNRQGPYDLEIHDTVFTDNHASGDRGGAILVGALFVSEVGTVRISDSVFEDNTSVSGAVTISTNAEIEQFSGDPVIAGGHVLVRDSQFTGNSSDGSAAIAWADEADIRVFDSEFTDNQTDFPQSLLVAVAGEICTTTFTDNSNPVFNGDFIDCGGNLFLGSSSDPFGDIPGRIVFHDDGNIRTIRPDGSDSQLLVSTNTFSPAPAWSPDGSQIVFVDGASFNSDLWRYSIENQQTVRLTNVDDVAATEPSWSVHDEIAYVRRAEGQGSNPFLIYVTTPDGGQGSHLTGTESAHDMERYPHWSPDGEELAFSVREDWSLDPNSTRVRLYTVGRDGSNRGRVSGFADANEPAWSPDGERLAYVLDGMVRIRNRDGSGDVITLAEGTSPTWSPDGAWVAFHRNGSLYRASGQQPDEPPVFITEGEQPHWSY
ncbi:Tol biopolymer transport system component [Natronocella acetinitrilica]|uniref:Tol biopolymer transport system component n=1 Tax=Natronocella acetinitrilica TaxID=414046 RepID=A0AAE3G5R1_9GAMM|nr:hypothetical protein [Natronocella acetinitrilica]MCP1676405.1 Tol biopolymer transport system component [Natronocella acetinitrilica]